MKTFYGFVLAATTMALGQLAWILTMTTNPLGLGGYLAWFILTFCPVIFFWIGVTLSSEDADPVEMDEDWEHVTLEGTNWFNE